MEKLFFPQKVLYNLFFSPCQLLLYNWLLAQVQHAVFSFGFGGNKTDTAENALGVAKGHNISFGGEE